MWYDIRRITNILIEKRFNLADCEFGQSIVVAELIKKMLLCGYVPNRLDVDFKNYKNCTLNYAKVKREDVEKLLKGTDITLVNFRNEYNFNKDANDLTLWLEYKE